MPETKNIAQLLRLIGKQYHEKKALNEREEGVWTSLSHQELLSEVRAMTLYLSSIGIKKGEHVGIVATSGIRWVIADLAIMACGGVTVPLFANISSENFLHECEQTNLKTLFVLGKEPWEMVRRHLSFFDRVLDLDDQKFLEQGRAIDRKNPELFDSLLDQIREDDLATIIYTSSSTGTPKGVMLTHRNLLFSSYTNFLELQQSDRFLSFLPLAHVYQRIATLYLLRWNVGVYFLGDPTELKEAFLEIKPTVAALVPRVVEKMYDQIMANLEKQGLFSRLVGRLAFKIALQFDSQYRFLHRVSDKLVYRKVRELLGGCIRGIVCGSASLNPLLTEFFYHLGIPIIEGYGMTEMMVISVNRLGHYKVGTVGPPCPGVEIKISSEGEILVKSEGVMLGYFQDPEATKKAIDSEGWLHTGDKGEIDSEGYLTILGRMDEIVKTSTGEWIALTALEKELEKIPFVDYAIVIAEHEKYVSALLFPDIQLIQSLKVTQNLSYLTDEQYLKSRYITHKMNRRIKKINAHRNHWEQIHAYRFVLTPPTIEGGELTPTLKLRRSNILEKYHDIITEMYPEDLAKQVEEQQ